MSTPLQLRDYQQQAVDTAVAHFRQHSHSAVMVLPTGAGKSIVIAELARIAKGNVLILTHVKELVAQNAAKASQLSAQISVYSAGLGQKASDGKTVVAGIQSAARNLPQFARPFSLVIIDECHRLSDDEHSQYQLLLHTLRQHNPQLRLLGLTATPYRLGSGWIYRRHYHGRVGNADNAIFEECIFELPLRPLIKQGYLTPPKLLDGLSAQYDFSQLQPMANGEFRERDVDTLLSHHGRATTAIIGQLQQLAQTRQGVIVFAASVRHAQEIITLLPATDAGLITANTATEERDRLIQAFRQQQLKYLVNVAVLTTGFDAPHVDLIAILRPTASVALFQQMVGRGLRLSPGKTDCLVIDYAANGFDLYSPLIPQAKPAADSVPVQVSCPACGFANTFWGKLAHDGTVLEHYGRRCQGLLADNRQQQCSYRFRARLCPDCGAENDIAARACHTCRSPLVDPDKRLREVLAQKFHHLFRVQQMLLQAKDEYTLAIHYLDIDGNDFTEYFQCATPPQCRALYAKFIKQHQRAPGISLPRWETAHELVALQLHFRAPDLLLLKCQKKRWQLLEKYFDYVGRRQHRKDDDATLEEYVGDSQPNVL